jgi:3-oxoacyl-[acyl-carrier-protein] synthase-3
MLRTNRQRSGFKIESIESCDFNKLEKLSNRNILESGRTGEIDQRLLVFMEKKMGIAHRYYAPKNLTAFDLAKNSLEKLVAKNPKILEEAEFLIFGGISNSLPTVCHAALLACDLKFKNASCWDLKSGCSTGVLALTQAAEWFDDGAKKGVIVCSETFSKFTDEETLQMSASIGDGAVALTISKDENWKIKGIVHGTDPEFFRSMFVPGTYPVDIENYDESDYKFKFEAKAGTLEKSAYYWNKSLEDLFEVTNTSGHQITHYCAHQIDGTKNKNIALAQGINESAIYLNFKEYGNMGCPTVFLNYLENMSKNNFSKGDKFVFHAVGGGLSWASLLMEKIS